MLVTESVLDAAIVAENAFQATSLTPATGPTIRMLATLEPHRLAAMHGSSYEGDCATLLSQLADFYEAELTAKSSRPPSP